MKKLPNRYYKIVFVFLMSVLITFVVSLGLMIINTGGVVISLWLMNWGKAFCVAFPTVYIMIPFVRKIASRVADE